MDTHAVRHLSRAHSVARITCAVGEGRGGGGGRGEAHPAAAEPVAIPHTELAPASCRAGHRPLKLQKVVCAGCATISWGRIISKQTDQLTDLLACRRSSRWSPCSRHALSRGRCWWRLDCTAVLLVSIGRQCGRWFTIRVDYLRWVDGTGQVGQAEVSD